MKKHLTYFQLLLKLKCSQSRKKSNTLYKVPRQHKSYSITEPCQNKNSSKSITNFNTHYFSELKPQTQIPNLSQGTDFKAKENIFNNLSDTSKRIYRTLRKKSQLSFATTQSHFKGANKNQNARHTKKSFNSIKDLNQSVIIPGLMSNQLTISTDSTIQMISDVSLNGKIVTLNCEKEQKKKNKNVNVIKKKQTFNNENKLQLIKRRFINKTVDKPKHQIHNRSYARDNDMDLKPWHLTQDLSLL